MYQLANHQQKILLLPQMQKIPNHQQKNQPQQQSHQLKNHQAKLQHQTQNQTMKVIVNQTNQLLQPYQHGFQDGSVAAAEQVRKHDIFMIG